MPLQDGRASLTELSSPELPQCLLLWGFLFMFLRLVAHTILAPCEPSSRREGCMHVFEGRHCSELVLSCCQS